MFPHVVLDVVGDNIIRFDDKDEQQLFDEGYADALNDLGDCYRYGYDTLQNYSKAVRFYRKAAELGNTSAMNNLGYCYQLGLGVIKDLFTAIKYYHKAAVKQNAKAHFYAWVIAFFKMVIVFFKTVMAARKTSSVEKHLKDIRHLQQELSN